MRKPIKALSQNSEARIIPIRQKNPQQKTRSKFPFNKLNGLPNAEAECTQMDMSIRAPARRIRDLFANGYLRQKLFSCRRGTCPSSAHSGSFAYQLLAVGLLLTSCSDSRLIRDIDDNVTVSPNETAESLYEKAATDMYMTNFKAAANGFAFVQEQFPYSKWALQAQIMEGYCRYQAHQFDDAIDLFTIFSKLHPRHEDAPYARYMIGLCNYERISIVERDQKDAHEALKAFRTLRKLFPACDYAKDAKFKIDFILNHLAAQEMSIGRFYQRQGTFIAAIGRFQNVIVKYPNTEQRPEALLRLAECYATLNMKDEFFSTYEMLRINHADSEWFRCADRIYQRFGNETSDSSAKKQNGNVESQSLPNKAKNSQPQVIDERYKIREQSWVKEVHTMKEEKEKEKEKYASPRYFDHRNAHRKDNDTSLSDETLEQSDG